MNIQSSTLRTQNPIKQGTNRPGPSELAEPVDRFDFKRFNNPKTLRSAAGGGLGLMLGQMASTGGAPSAASGAVLGFLSGGAMAKGTTEGADGAVKFIAGGIVGGLCGATLGAIGGYQALVIGTAAGAWAGHCSTS